jgi:high-affinity nickel-transport protein
MEFSVGLMLVALGAMNVVAFMRSSRSISSGVSADASSGDPEASAVVHSHPHSHGSHIHSHTHVHSANVHPHEHDHSPLTLLDRWFGRRALYQQVRPLVVGVVHGLAGSAAVALLVLTTIRNPRWAVAYLLIFGVGTIGGMVLITVSIASAFSFLGRGQQKFSRHLALASGLISLVFGVVLAYQIGIAHGLFTGNPQWTPR